MRNQGNVLPFVSVVVPVYNGESTIKNCLDHIMKLKYSRAKLQVIVVDDGSTDKTVNILKGYSIKLVKKEHGGYPSAMNAGMKIAKGEIVVIIDSDVYVSEDWLIKIIEEFKDPKVGIVGGNGEEFVPSTSGFWTRIIAFEAQDRYDMMKSKYLDFITSASTAYRKKLFTEIGLFDEALRRGSDEDLAHRALKAGWKIVLRKDALSQHDWDFPFKNYFVKQVFNTCYQVRLVLRYPELLSGKQQHPASLYIPIILTFLLLLTPFWVLINSIWVPALSLLGLILYHTPQAIRIIRKRKDWSMIIFPIVINVRYVAWLIGIPIGVLKFMFKSR